MMRLGEAARRLRVGHKTIQEYLASIRLPIPDDLDADLTERQCKKLFLKFVPCEPDEVETGYAEFLSDKFSEPKHFGNDKTKVSVRTIPTAFETDRSKH